MTAPLQYCVTDLRDIVADVALFQTRTLSANATKAKDHIRLYDWEGRPETLADDRTFASIMLIDCPFVATAFGDQNELIATQGTLDLQIVMEDKISGDTGKEVKLDSDAAYLDFLAFLEAIIDGLRNNAAKDTHLPITDIRFKVPPIHSPRMDDPTTGPYWHAILAITWGLRGGGA